MAFFDPRTDAPQEISLLGSFPVYGLWGGPGWSYGTIIGPGTPVDLTHRNANVFVDEMDAAFRQHDIEWSFAENIRDIVRADLELLVAMEAVDVTKLSTYGRGVHTAAKAFFTYNVKANFEAAYPNLTATVGHSLAARELAFGSPELAEKIETKEIDLRNGGFTGEDSGPLSDPANNPEVDDATEIDGGQGAGMNSAEEQDTLDDIGDMDSENPTGMDGAGGGAELSGDYDAGWTPLALDLDGDGVELVDIRASTAFFDLNGDGYRTYVGWVSADDGVLAYDKNSDGIIQDADEVSFLSYVEGAETDLEGLVHFDSNSDGVFNSSDSKWDKFGVWQDLDQDGETDAGEFHSLATMGVTSIDLTSDGIEYVDGSNHVFGTGSYTVTGNVSKDLADVRLATSYLGFRHSSDGGLEFQGADGSKIYQDSRFSNSNLDLSKSGYVGAFGSDEEDVFLAGDALDVLLDGGAGNDTLEGGIGNDWLYGGGGSDVLNAGDGDDLLFVDFDDFEAGGSVKGGGGFDAAIFNVEGNSFSDISVNLKDLGLEAIFSGDGADNLASGYVATDETEGQSIGIYLDGGGGNDEITGGDGDDWLIGGEGTDTLSGGLGDDILFVDSADGTTNLAGGDGVDTLIVQDTVGLTLALDTAGIEKAFGSDGDDVFSSSGSADVLLDGGDGNDTLSGGSGDDTLSGSMGDDRLVGGAGEDVYMFGYGYGNDRIDESASDDATATDRVVISSTTGRFSTAFARSGDDLSLTLAGSDDSLIMEDWFADPDKRIDHFVYTGLENSYAFVADDTANVYTAQTDDHYHFVGLAGDDTLTGAGGHDLLDGGVGADVLDGGTGGSDTVTYAGSDAAVSVDLVADTASGGHAAGDSLDNIENLYGSDFGDTLTGDGNANILTGNDGADTLSGAAGEDTLIGGAGADVLSGGDGVDLASYLGSGFDTSTGVTIDLSLGTGAGGDAEGDTLSGIEDVTGTVFDDTLAGDASANTLRGEDGQDTFVSSMGNDTLIGGTGDDVATYDGNSGAFDIVYDRESDSYTVADKAPALHGDEGTDTLSGIERVTFAADGVALDLTATPVAWAAKAGLPTDGSGSWVLRATGGQLDENGDADLVFAAESAMAAITHSAAQALGFDPAQGAVFATDHGHVQVTADGTYRYVAGSAYTGEDSFSFRVTDMATGLASVAAVSLYVGVAVPAITEDDPIADNLFVGGTGNDEFFGGSGRDAMEGGLGDDTLDGGSGADEARWQGASTDFDVVYNAAENSFTVTDLNTADGDEGTDTVRQVGALSFAGDNVTKELTDLVRAFDATAKIETDSSAAWSFTTEGGVGPYTFAIEGLAASTDAGYPAASGWYETANGFVRVTDVTNGTYEYVPATGYVGPDEFQFRVTDSRGFASVAAIDVGVGPIDGEYQVPEAEAAHFRLNTYTTERQDGGKIAAFSDGGYVGVWNSYGQDGSEHGIYGRIFNADGTEAVSEFRFNTATTDQQVHASVAALSGDDFVAAWIDKIQDGSSTGVYGQRFDKSGNKLGSEFRINTTTSGQQGQPHVLALEGGGFFASYTSADPTDYGVFGKIYADDGTVVVDEFRLNTTTTGDQYSARFVATLDGGFIAAWQSDGQDGDDMGVYFQRFDGVGNTLGTETLVNGTTTGAQSSAAVTVLADGRILITWSSGATTGTADKIMGRLFDADGNSLGTEFQISETSSHLKYYSSVEALGDGGFVVVWNSTGQDGDQRGVYGRRFDADANALGGEFRINDVTTGDQEEISTALMPDGRLAVTWTSRYDGTTGMDTSEVYTRFYTFPDAYGQPSEAGDYLEGTDDVDELNGLGGDDLLLGGLGDDTLSGGAGVDTVEYAGLSTDFDVVYDAETGLITVTDTNAADGDEGTDTVSGVETLSFTGDSVTVDLSSGLPSASAGAARLSVDGFVDWTLSGSGGTFSLMGDTDSDDVITTAAGGTVTLTDATTGTYTYAPASGYEGTDTFDFRVTDGLGISSTSTVDVSVGATQGGYDVAGSVSLNGSDEHVSLTPTSDGTSLTAATVSLWFKRDTTSNTDGYIFGSQLGSGHENMLYFRPDGELEFRMETTSGGAYYIRTTAQYTSTTEWMHVVAVYDADNATSADRMRLYVDGARVTSLSNDVQPPQGTEMEAWNNANETMRVGAASAGTLSNHHFDGTMAEAVYVDGQALDASAFGEDDGQGNWVAKEIVGAELSSPAELLIAGSEGTAIGTTPGSMDTSYANAFDGNASQGWLSATSTGGNPSELAVGKDFGVGNERVFTQFVITSSSDKGFVEGVNPSGVVLEVYGSTNGTASGGTLLGSTASFTDNDTTTVKTITSTDTTTAYRGYYVRLSKPSSGGGTGNLTIGEIEAYEQGTVTGFGDNGFHLDFADANDLGNDVSGNANDLTLTGIDSSNQSTEVPDGTPGAVAVTATAGNDSLEGTADADVIDGLGGDDQLIGGAGDDTLTGGMNDDLLLGGLGNDTLSGGAGLDVVEYAGLSTDFDVVYDAETGLITVTDTNAADGDEGTDTVSGVETLSFTGDSVTIDLSSGLPSASAGAARLSVDGFVDWTLSGSGGTFSLMGDTDSDDVITTAAGGTVTLTDATTGTYTYAPASGYEGDDSFDFHVTDANGIVSTATADVIVGVEVPPPVHTTMNPNDMDSAHSLSTDNLTITFADTDGSVRAVDSVLSSGKWYWEYTINSGSDRHYIGITTAAKDINMSNQGIAGENFWRTINGNQRIYYNGTNSVYDGGGISSGDTVMVAYDADGGKLYFGKNGSWLQSSDPSTDTSPAISGIDTTEDWFPTIAFSGGTGTSSGTLNFGENGFVYTPPTGYVDVTDVNLGTAPPGSVVFDPTSGNDSLEGTADADVIDGLGGDDQLTGGAGDDTLTGGAGEDTVVFAGAVGGYAIDYDAGTDTYTVTDTDATNGDEGADTVIGVEHFEFSGGTLTAAEVQAGPDASASAANLAKNGSAEWSLSVDGGTGALNYSVENGGTAIDTTLATTLGFDTQDGDVFETANGHVQIKADGTYEYRPDTGYEGTDTFDFRVTDGLGISSTSTVDVSVGATQGGYDVAGSVSLNGSDEHVSLTPTSDGTSLTAATVSLWFKRDTTSNTDGYIFGSQLGSGHENMLYFRPDGELEFRMETTSGGAYYIRTTAQYTSTTEWMHVVAVYDADNATSADRMRLYVDGARVTSLSNDVQPPQGTEMEAWNNANETMRVGAASAGTLSNHHFDGTMAEAVYVDGQALDASAFGEDDGQGNWVAKEIVGAELSSPAELLIAGSEGTAIGTTPGSMDTSYANAFDGNASQGWLSATSTGGNPSELAVGKDFGVGNERVFTQFVITSSSDKGFVEGVNPSGVVLEVYGSTNGTASGGTLLGSTASFTDNDTTTVKTITSTDTTTAYRGYYVRLSKPSSGGGTGNLTIGEIEAYEQGTVTGFGDNGFHLDFADANDLGNDVSGNANDLTLTGIDSSNQSTEVPDGTPGAVAVTATAGNDSLEGTADADVIDGLGGDDQLIGGAGDDTLTGGAGEDTVVFAGAVGGYAIDYDAGTDTYTVTDTDATNGDEGADTVIGVEHFEFSGGTLTAAEVQAGPDASASAANLAKNGSAEWSLSVDGGTGALNYSVENGGTAIDTTLATTLGFDTQDGDVFETANGHVQIKADGTYEYRPDTGYEGTDTFDFRVTDSLGITNTASIDISVGASDPTLLQPTPSGASVQLNTTTSNTQAEPALSSFSDGSYVATWSSYEQDGSQHGIFGQLFDSSGAKVGSEFQVNTYTSGQQTGGNNTVLSNGDFVVVWTSADQDGSSTGIYGQHYNSAGVKQGSEFRANTHTTNQQGQARVTALTGGGFVISWNSLEQDGDSYGIYGQIYDAGGAAQGSEFRMNTETTDKQSSPRVSATSDGGFVAVWYSYNQDGDGYGVYGQRFDSSGAKVGSEFRANSTTSGEQLSPDVVVLSDGGFVVTWAYGATTSTTDTINGQLYDSNGNAIGGEFQISETSSYIKNYPVAVALEDGGFAVVWSSTDQDGDSGGVYGRRFDADGNSLGGEFAINDTTTGNQEEIKATLMADGQLGVVWRNPEIHARFFDLPAAFQIAESASGNDSLEGTADADVIDGLGGDDQLTGGAGDDTLTGGAGEDTVVFAGAVGGYAIDYDAGTDTYTVTDTDATNGDEGADTVIGVEHFEFSGGTLTAAEVQAGPDASASAANLAKNGSAEWSLSVDGGTGALNYSVENGGTAIDTTLATTLGFDTQDGDVFETANGHVQIKADGTYEYRPDTGYEGTDTFDFRVTDGLGISSTSTVDVSVGATQGGYDVAGSVSLNGSDEHVSLTPTSDGTSLTAATVSLWFKRDTTSNTDGYIFGSQLGSGHENMLYFRPDGELEFRMETTSGGAYYIRTTAQYTSTTEWMHVVAVYDADNATSADRMRLYVDGARVTSLSNDVQPPQGTEMEAWNNANETMRVGAASAGTLSNHHFDGTMAEAVYVDGQALDASAFGEDDGQGNWVAKEIVGAELSSPAELLIAGSEGTAIGTTPGSMDTSYANAFDGNASQGWLSATSTGGNPSELAVGKDFGVGNERVFTQFVITSSSDKGFVEGVNPSGVVLEVYGSTNGTASGGTLLGSTASFTDNDTTTVKTITSTDTTTAYRGYYVRLSKPSSGGGTGNLTIGEIEAYEQGTVTGFGDNGFHLDFADANDLGNDVSGNANDLTLTGIDSSNQSTEVPDGTPGAVAVTATAGNDSLEGTADADVIDGLGGDDQLIGGAGDDTLTGGAGEDTVTGGLGDDIYKFGRGDGADLVDNTGESTSSDKIMFAPNIDTDQLWFSQVGNDLVVDIIGTDDSITIDEWYTGADNRIANFETNDGSSLAAADVANLVSAMAALTPPAVGETELSAALHTSLDATIAANWDAPS